VGVGRNGVAARGAYVHDEREAWLIALGSGASTRVVATVVLRT